MKTEVRCCYDDRRIAFKFTCFDSEMDKVVREEKRGDADLFKVMLAPAGNGAPFPYYYFRVHYDNGNAHTVKVDEGGTMLSVSRKNLLDYEAVFTKKDDRWLARIVIPFATLEQKGPPAPGTEWRFNLVRKIRRNPRGDALRCEKTFGSKLWGFHAPAGYDCLVFK